jgi:hypothetical protein
LIGKHGDEATIHRAAHAFEQGGDWRRLQAWASLQAPVSDATVPPGQPRRASASSPDPAMDPLAEFYALLPSLESRAFRLAGLQGFSGLYRLIEVDDVENAVIIARERDGQRLGLGIADFLDAYRQGYNT